MSSSSSSSSSTGATADSSLRESLVINEQTNPMAAAPVSSGGDGGVNMTSGFTLADTLTSQTPKNVVNSSLDDGLSFNSIVEAEIDEENPNFGKFQESSFMSSWVKDKADEYDFCMVVPLDDHGNLPKRSKDYVYRLRKCGIETYIYKGFQAEGKQKEAYILLRADQKNLKRYAEIISFRMELDSMRVKELLEAGDVEHNIAPVIIHHDPTIVRYEPWVFIYSRYTDTVEESLYWRPKNIDNPFRPLVKLKLTSLLVESRPPSGGEPMKIRRYLANGWILGFFPLHDRSVTDGLSKKWLAWKTYPWNAPFYRIKEYYGEKIGLYFVFMGHYTKWLLFPALLGIPFQIAIFAQNDFSAPYLPVLSFIVSLWAIVMLEFWKRKEKKYALEWGTLDCEKTEQDRPDFRGVDMNSLVNGSKIKYFPPKQRSIFQAQSGIVIFLMVLAVVGVVASVYLIKYTIEDNDCTSQRSNNAQTIASVLNAVMIQVMNFLYSLLAKEMNRRENHRTDTAYEDSMITKIFLFQFVNSYASFFYLAFVQSFIPNACGNTDAGDATMRALAINLAIVFITRIVSGNLTELLIPYFSFQIRYGTTWLTSGKMFTSGHMSRPEKEYLLVPYDTMAGSLDDYAEVAIQFGYNSLFLVALPLASLFGLFSNFIECKGDAWKLLTLQQRPVPVAAEDIGTWQTIFLALTVVSVITNAGLICFTMDTFDQFEGNTLRLWVFVLFQWVLFSLQALLMGAIPDIPEEIVIQQDRQEFIISKVVDKVEDDKPAPIDVEDGDVEFQVYPINNNAGYKDDAENKNVLTDNMRT